MKFAIVGSGGVGGYFGGKLASAGHDVTFLARGNHLKAIQERGLTVKSHQGDFSVYPAKATDSIDKIGEVDVVLVCLKAWQVAPLAKSLLPLIGPQTTIIPLENGVLATEELRSELPPNSVIRGLCRIFSMKEADGIINHFGIEPTVIFGEDDNQQTARIVAIQEAFTSSGIKAIVPKDIEQEVWKKFLFICSSALLAVARSPYGAIREIPETRQMLKQLFEEIYLVGKAKGVNLKPDIVESTISLIDTFSYDTTSSLTRDVMEGRPSEIEYQNGTIVKMGKELGIETPINAFIYYSILPMERKARI
jgi:2-dehydropantoate 2-reductase